MTSAERVKTARMLAALAKPLIQRAGGMARTGVNLLRDFRPGSGMIQPLQRMAAGAERQIGKADAYSANLGKWGQRAMGAGQFAAGVAPGAAAIGAVASGKVSPWMMPVWNTAMHAGRAGGQMIGWRDPNQTRQWMEQGANDTILGVNQQLQQLSFPDRIRYLSAMHDGSWMDPNERASRMAAGQQPQAPSLRSFLPGSEFSPGGQDRGGDMSSWLLQQAMNKGAAMTKAARAKAFMGLLRGVGKSIGKMFGHQPALGRSGVPFRQPAFPVPMRPPSMAQNAGKWGWQGAKHLAGGAAIPLAVGGAGGFFNADLDAQQAGSDLALSRMQQGMAGTGGFKRTMVAMDPSLMMQQAQGASPGLFNRYRQVYGEDFQPGFLSSIQQWAGNMGKELKNPSFLAADSSGIRNIPTT